MWKKREPVGERTRCAWTMRGEEAEKVVEAVAVAGASGLGGEYVGAVAVAAEADAVAGFVADGFHLRSELALASVEGGIDVDELDGVCVHGLQNVEVVPLHNTVHAVSRT